MTTKRQTLKIDLSKGLPATLASVDFARASTVIVTFPLSSLGSTNSLLDICADLLEASWILERLASKTTRIATKVGTGYYRPLVTAKLTEPHSDLAATLADCALLFAEEDPAEAALAARRDELWGMVLDYEDEIHAVDPKVPEMADWYFVNLVASYGEWASESPEYVAEQIQKFPERRVGFHRSAWSSRLGANCYGSHDAWVVPVEVVLDHFFKVTGQRYRRPHFVEGQLEALNGRPFIRAGDMFVAFPARRYFASQVCAGFSMVDREDSWSDGPFGWGMASQYRAPSADGFAVVHAERYLVDATGTMIVVEDGMFQHIFSEVLPLNQRVIKTLLADSGQLSQSLSIGAGISATATFDWRSISDEAFEELCYDIIYAHPKFDTDTVKKFGKARSRDGGRDIEVFEAAARYGEKPRKWVFQCKLVTDGSSLGKSKVVDVGDMLVQFGADGFGVMTNTFIDATLFDKLELVCRDRQVSELHFSRLEIERALVANSTLRKKYFPD